MKQVKYVLIIPFDLDARGLVCFLGVPQQHQRYLLLIVANLYISVLIKMYEKNHDFTKNMLFFDEHPIRIGMKFVNS